MTINLQDIKYNLYKVIVVGCGGTGSQLLPSLFQLASNTKKIKEIVLVDGDNFEVKNCQNQKCLKEEAGDNKASALAARFNYVYEGSVSISSYPHYIKSKEELINITKDDRNIILIGCVDNNSTRKVLHEFFTYIGEQTMSNIIYIDSGNGDFQRVGQVIVGAYCNGKKLSKSVVDLYPEVLDGDEDLENITPCTRQSSEHPQNIATNIFAANIIFATITNIIMYDKIEKSIMYFDVDNISLSTR